MNRFLTTLLAGAALIGTVSASSATTISGGSGAINNTLTDYNLPIGTFTLFDTTLGTLNSVTFTYGYGFTSTVTVNATTNASGSVRAESAAQFSSSTSAINSVLTAMVDTTSAAIGTGTLNPAAYDLLGTSRSYTLSAGNSQNYSSSASLSSTSVTDNQSADLTAFEAAGGGSFSVLAQTLTGTVISSSGGNASATQSTQANQTFSITYDYTAPVTGVPEPASMALLGAGLVGAGLVRRRK